MLNTVFEIAIYEIIDLLMNGTLVLIAFRRSLRFRKSVTVLLLLSLFLILIFCRTVSLKSVSIAGVLSVFLILVCLVYCLISFKAQLNRLLFVLLIIINYSSFVTIVYSFLTSHFVLGLKLPPYSFHSSGILFGILLCTCPPLAFLMKLKIEPLISSGINNKAWNYLWIMPAAFCCSYYFHLYTNGGFRLYTKEFSNVLFSIIYNYSGILITFLIAYLVKDSNEILQVKAEKYILDLQMVQSDNMNSYMEEIRRAKHDMRQMLVVIQSSFLENDISQLKEYVSRQIYTTIPSDQQIHYCDSFALNALFTYYGNLTKKSEVQFWTTINSSLDYHEAEPDLVVLFGNLLENAYEACIKVQTDQSFINLVIRRKEDAVVVTVDNSYNGVVKESGGHLLSSKRNGIGVGVSSIKRVVEKYYGSYQYEYNSLVFKVSLVLKIN